MWGIRADRKLIPVDVLILQQNRIWVDKEETDYTVKKEAKRYKTKKKATHAMCEPWESVVKL